MSLLALWLQSISYPKHLQSGFIQIIFFSPRTRNDSNTVLRKLILSCSKATLEIVFQCCGETLATWITLRREQPPSTCLSPALLVSSAPWASSCPSCFQAELSFPSLPSRSLMFRGSQCCTSCLGILQKGSLLHAILSCTVLYLPFQYFFSWIICDFLLVAVFLPLDLLHVPVGFPSLLLFKHRST